MESAVSEKNTKTEILKVYETLLKAIENAMASTKSKLETC
jgi:hypothetical protein